MNRCPTAVLPIEATVTKALAAPRHMLAHDRSRTREFLRRHVGTVILTRESESPDHSYRATGAIKLSGLLGAEES